MKPATTQTASAVHAGLASLSPAPSPEAYPDVSVIVPCRNEQVFIEESVRSILDQDYPGGIEVLVVDGLSEDRTRSILQRLVAIQSASATRRLQVLDNPHRVVPVALNIGLRHAKGAVVFRLDGHSRMAPGYVRACVAKLQERPDVACVGGPSVAVAGGCVGAAYALALQSPFGVGGGTFRTCRSETFVDTLAFGGYRKDVVSEMGGFDSELHRNQDIHFSAALRKAGHRLLLIQDTQTLYHAPDTLRCVIKQNYRNGYWNTRVLDKMIGVLSWRHFVPLVFVVALLAAIVLAVLWPWGSLAFWAIAGSYLVVSGLVTAAVAMRHRRLNALLLPVIFLIMHLSYGCGSIVGLSRFVLSSR
ncbi:glycosyltransferase family 2 protein [Candidatus Nitrospira bockiana]